MVISPRYMECRLRLSPVMGRQCLVRNHMWFDDRCAPCTRHRCKREGASPQDAQNSLPIYGACSNFSQPCCWVVVVSTLRTCFGFILRTVGADDQQNLTYDAVDSLLLLAPLREISEVVPERRIFLLSYFSGKKTFTCMVVARLICILHPRRQALGVSVRWLRRLCGCRFYFLFCTGAVPRWLASTIPGMLTSARREKWCKGRCSAVEWLALQSFDRQESSVTTE